MSAQATEHFIVYVDDDEDDLLFVEQSLAAYAGPIPVQLFQHSLEAYQYLLRLELLQKKPCLLILDINMPWMSGKELLIALRAHAYFDNVPIILFSTSNAEPDRAFAETYQAGFITKPIESQQMKTIAEVFLSHCPDNLRQPKR